MLKTTQLKQTEKQRYSTLLSQYSYGKNKFTVDDITVLANAMALGKPSRVADFFNFLALLVS